MRRTLIVILLTAILATSLFAAGGSETSAPAFPNKPIHVVVYTAAGGAGDILARRAMNIAAKYTDATFVVENKPGGGGIVAMGYVRSPPADGYTPL